MINSKENKLIKHIKALNQKKYRDEYKEYIVEGIKMSLEATKYAKILNILVNKELLGDKLSQIEREIKKNKLEDKLEYVSENIFKSICDTKTPQGILIVAKQSDVETKISDDTLFVLDDIQDPGNLGTIIRTLESAGYKDLIVSRNTADAYNTKVIRSTMGAIFRLNIYRLDEELKDYLQKIKKEGYKIAVSTLDNSNYIYDVSFKNKMAIVIGNESQGVKKEIQEIADIRLKIPMIGKTESLNASVATSIIAYEKVRQTLTKEK